MPGDDSTVLESGQTPDESRPGTATDNTANKPTVLDIHGYKIGRTVGHGSYATVKEAFSQRHKCQVGIKVISKRRAPGDYLEKFLPREIDVVKLLKHPSLIVFLQSIETNNRVYLIMEYASGGDLLDVIRERRHIKEGHSGLWFYQLVEGVDYCHKKGVVHRDLKCENLLIDRHGNLKITDFGFARGDMAQVKGEFKYSETYCGSYAYAPPEILTGTPYIPQLADIWSMGVILYVMVCGRLPFDDSNHKKLLKQVNRGAVFPEHRDVAKDCKDLIAKILVKREQRLSLSGIRAHPWFMRVSKPYTKPSAKSSSESSSSKTGNNPKASSTKTSSSTKLQDKKLKSKNSSSSNQNASLGATT